MKAELAVATELAQQAGGLIAANLGRVGHVGHKSPVNLVTEVDTAAERLIVDGLTKAFPDAAIVAEETAADSRPAGPCWYVDPIDGTTNFVHGLPHCAVSIALVVDREPAVGVVHDPCKRETFTATRNGPARLNGEPIRVSEAASLADSLLVTGFPYDRCQRLDFYVSFFREFLARCRDVRRFGSAALDLCYVAAGRFDGFWEFGLRPWDTAAGWLVVERAGGRVTDFAGCGFDPWKPQVLATNGRVHEEALAVLAQAASA
ncbi:MAG: inositol monophosphatase [Candidatus Dadabacteria bacterium]|nr:MAG: inositol monophosphatase [Candidatus Dadabacteria bacterium]